MLSRSCLSASYLAINVLATLFCYTMQVFQEFGKFIDSRWREANYDEHAFPSIAAQALIETQLTDRVDPWEIIRWVHQTTDLPQQADIEARFGNPPVTLYMGSRFYVDVYYWLDGTTEIHQHSFSGAFQVLLGSSIHSRYSFSIEREINPHFIIGKLKLNDVTLLTKGDIQQIVPGSDYIHALFHLDRPSATITVRTKGTPAAQPQYSYKRPSIAYDPFFKNDLTARKLQTVSLLYAMKHPEADRFLEELIGESDFQTTFLLLERAFSYLSSNDMDRLFGLSANTDRCAALLDRARVRHGELIDLLPPVFEEGSRLQDIVKRRGTITSEDHRFFLALLLNVSERERLLAMVKSRFPNRRPIDIVLDWIEELYKTKVLGSNESNALGIDGFDDNYLFVLEGLLEGRSAGDIKEKAKSEYPGEQAATVVAERVEAISKRLKSSQLLRQLLQ